MASVPAYGVLTDSTPFRTFADLPRLRAFQHADLLELISRYMCHDLEVIVVDRVLAVAVTAGVHLASGRRTILSATSRTKIR